MALPVDSDSDNLNVREDRDWIFPESSRTKVLSPSPSEEAFQPIPAGSVDLNDESPRSSGKSGYTFTKPIGFFHRAHNPYNNTNSRNEGLDNPIPRSDRALLCERMLNDVANSVTKFKPSASISAMAQMDEGGNFEVPEFEIDLVLTGGGLKGYFMAGASYILLRELEKQNVRIARVAGASAGAWAGFFILTGFSSADWLETYFGCQRNLSRTLLEAYEDMWPFVRTLIPDDAYLQCSGKLFISITQVTPLGLKNHMVSQYDSNEDLFQACCCSSTIPFLTQKSWTRKYKGMFVVDGGFTNNTPLFEDGLRRQLVFKLFEVEYPWRLLTTANDSCIEALVLRGAILMSRFLQGDTMKDGSISWLERRENKSPLTLPYFRPPSIIKVLLAPIIVSAIVASNGFRHLLQAAGLWKKRAKKDNDANIVVPFDSYKKDSPVSYLRWVLWGSMVETLQRWNILL